MDGYLGICIEASRVDWQVYDSVSGFLETQGTSNALNLTITIV